MAESDDEMSGFLLYRYNKTEQKWESIRVYWIIQIDCGACAVVCESDGSLGFERIDELRWALPDEDLS